MRKRTSISSSFAAAIAILSFPTASQAVVLGDLEGYWTFDNNANLGEDSGPNGNDLTATGTPTYNAAGKFGGASDYDGDQGASSDALTSTVFPTGIPVGNDAYSISAWLNPDDDTPGNGGIISWGNNSNSNKNATRLASATGYQHYWWSNDLPSSGLADQVAGDVWHHVVATYDPTIAGPTHNQFFYVDGVLTASRAASGKDTFAQDFFIGRAANTGETINGRLDDVAVFSAPLTSNDVDFLWNNGAGNTVAALIPEPTAGVLGLLGLGLILRRRR